MPFDNLHQISLPPAATLRDALITLDRTGRGIVLVVNDEDILEGVITDGDVRRSILAGAGLDSALQDHVKREFTFARVGMSREQLMAMMSESIRHLPVIDEKGRATDLICWSDYWRLPIMEPTLVGNELAYVTECIHTNWISSQGKFVDRFQDAFAEYLDMPHALSTSSGTAALHLALVALGIGPGDEVIVPDLTFGASANVVIHAGARPVFCDVDPYTWTIDVEDAARRITSRTRAIMPVHLYGHPCDMDPLMALAKANKLWVVEDCAESLGATYKGRKAGTFGDVSCFSFFANKVITTGEGGMTVTNHADLHEKMAILRDHGMSKERRYWHLYPGFNYRMTNMQAAIGLAQLERIESFLNYREVIVKRYDEELGPLPGVEVPPRADWGKSIFWLYSILVEEERSGISSTRLAEKLHDYGIETRRLFTPLHGQPAYRDTGVAKGDFPVAARLHAQGLSLPTSNDLSLKLVEKVCATIKSSTEGARFTQQVI